MKKRRAKQENNPGTTKNEDEEMESVLKIPEKYKQI